jgi:hypothetical protein
MLETLLGRNQQLSARQCRGNRKRVWTDEAAASKQGTALWVLGMLCQV